MIIKFIEFNFDHYQIIRLPVPQLDVTITKYLTAVKPLLTEQEFEKTKIVKYLNIFYYPFKVFSNLLI